MKNLLYKDFRLAASPVMYAFLALTAMMLIPSYPYYVVFFYCCLGIFFTFQNARECRDAQYAATLPVRKRDAVKARLVMMTLVELLFVAVSVPFAVLNAKLIPEGNAAGMDCNAALYGLVLLMLGLFNLTFAPIFYRDGRSVGKAFLIACTVMLVYILVCESSVHAVPWVKIHLDNREAEFRALRLGILAAGAALFALLTWRACAVSQKLYERAEL